MKKRLPDELQRSCDFRKLLSNISEVNAEVYKVCASP